MIKIKNLSNKGEIYIYGTIVDDTDAKWLIGENGDVLGYEFPQNIRDQLASLEGLPIDVHISSYGGDVSAAVVIYNMLSKHNAPVTVFIDSLAASAASLIAFAGQKIIMPENTFLMIHNPQGGGFGSAEYLLSIVDYLDKLKDMIAGTYEKHVKNNADIRALMDAETWIPAKEASEMFDNVEITASNDIKAVASFDVKALDNYKNVPDELKQVLAEKSIDEPVPEPVPEKPVDNVDNDKKYILSVLEGAFKL